MANILLAWELGAGFGHVRSLLPIARRLAEAGHSPVLALRETIGTWPVWREAEFPVLQAPRLSRPTPPGFLAASFADVLAIHGFDTQSQLKPLVEGWQRLFDLTQAELVIAEHAPAALLAAYGWLPAVQAGMGFSIPPTGGETFPVLATEATPLCSHEQLLETVAEVQRSRKRAVPQTLPGLFQEARPFMYVFPEFDVYRRLRSLPAVDCAPFHELPTVTRNEEPTHDYFAYSSPDYQGLAGLLGVLSRMGLRGMAYLWGASAEFRDRVAQQGVKVFSSPPRLGDVLPDVRFAINHAGIGTAQDALSVGLPQLLLPRHLEQSLTADALVETGAALSLKGRVSGDAIEQAVARLLTDENLRANAERWSGVIAERRVNDVVGRIVEHCGELLGG